MTAPLPHDAAAATLTAPTAPWWEGRIAGLDFETTGTDPLNDRPVSVSLLLERRAGDIDPLLNINTVVDAGVPVPAESSAVHGITAETIAAEGVNVAVVMAGVLEALAGLAELGIPVVIMNARFDWPLLRAEAARHGLALPTGVQLVDPGVLDRFVDSRRPGKRTLSDLARHYGVVLADAHDAKADVRGAIAVTRAIFRRYTGRLAGFSLADLQGAQAQWFAAWRDDLNAHWQRTGKSGRITGNWPWGEA